MVKGIETKFKVNNALLMEDQFYAACDDFHIRSFTIEDIQQRFSMRMSGHLRKITKYTSQTLLVGGEFDYLNLVDLRSKKVANSRESADGFRARDLPLTIVSQDWFLGAYLRKIDHADVSILRCQFLQILIIGGIDAPLHIGLARADPHFANQNIVKGDCFIGFDCQLVRSTGG